MNDKLFELNDGGVINANFDSIENCEIINPTYNKEGYSSLKIMLDKRKGLIEELHKEGILFTDIVKIDGQYFYYGIDKLNNLSGIYNENGLKIYELPYEEGNPLRVAKGIGGGGQIVLDGTTGTNSLNPVFEDGLISLTLTGASAGQYITFTTGELKGITEKILLSEGGKIYIQATDIVGTLPEGNAKFYIFTELRDTILIGSANTVHIVHTTDRDDSLDNKYIIQLEDSGLKHYSLAIDGVNVYFTTNIPSEVKTYLEGELSSDYHMEIIKGFLYLWKTNGTEIIFSDFKNGYVIDFQPVSLGTKNERSYGGLRINIDGNIVSTSDKYLTLSHYNPFGVFGNYAKIYYNSSYGQEGVLYYKNSNLDGIRVNLPAGYNGKLFDIGSLPATFYHQGPGTNEMITYNYNRRLFISRDDGTTFPASIEPFHYYIINFHSIDNVTRDFNFDGVTDSGSIGSGGNTGGFVSEKIFDKLLQTGKYRVARGNWTGGGTWYIGVQVPHGVTVPFSVTSTNNFLNIQEKVTDIPNERYSTCELYSDKVTPTNINDTNGHGYVILDGLTSNVKDVVPFNGAMFALTDTHVYFSRSYMFSNTHFFSFDFFLYKNGLKLIPFGKTLLALGEDNKLITSFLGTFYTIENAVNYQANDLEYNGNIYSKYSYLYDEGNLYVLEDSKRLVILRLNQIDQFSYTVVTEEVNIELRWLFDKIKGECFVNRHGSSFNFLSISEGKTTNYKFDISLRTWIENKYEYEIYHMGEKVLTNNRIGTQGGLTDFGTEYSQTINMSVGNLINFTQLFMIRTIFGLNNEFTLDLTRTIEYELGEGKIYKEENKLNNYNFDTDNNLTLDEGDLTDEPENVYGGSIASIQHSLSYAGKYIRIKYHSDKRFIIGDTYLLTRLSKPYINNILNSN